MFANLKKKLEEEVGDLGRLASPMNLAGLGGGALGDRRVGSTQGTNTPNLGSRQSSVASLVDISTTPNSQSRAPSQSRSGGGESGDDSMHIKKINNDWKAKLESLKKSYEEKLQNQEADFAWKYSSKDDELMVVRNERDRLSEQLKVVESNWQDKFIRVSTDLEQFEGFSRQENAKVKHLLLNTQSELQTANVRVAELESKLKNNHDDYVREENNKLAFQENEIISLRKELETFKLNSEQNSSREITKFTQEIGALKIELDHFKSMTSKLEEERNKALKLSENVAHEKNLLEESLTANESIVNSLQTELEDFKTQVAKLVQQNDETYLQLEELKTLNNHTEEELQKAKVQESELQAANVRIAELELTLKNNRDEYTTEETNKLVSQENTIASLREELQSLQLASALNLTRATTKFKEDVDTLKIELDHVKSLNSKLQEEKKQTLQASESVAEDKRRLEESLTAHENIVDSLNVELEEAKTQVVKLEQEKDKILMQLEELKTLKNRTEEELHKQKSEFQAANVRISELESTLKNNRDGNAREENKKLVFQENVIASLREELQSLQLASEQNLTRATTKFKEDVDTLKIELDNLKSLNSKLQEEKKQTLQASESVAEDKRRLEESLTAHKNIVDSVNVELTDFKSQVAILKQEKDKILMQLEELKTLKNRTEEELQKAKVQESELQAANVRIAELELTLTNNRDEYAREENKKLVFQENAIASLREELQSLQLASEQNFTRATTKFKEDVDTLKIELDNLKSLNSKLQEEKNQTSQTSESVAEDKRRLEESLTAHENIVDSLNVELEEAKTQVAKLEQEKDEILMQLEEVNILKNHSDDELKIVTDRSTDLYTEVTELKKSLRMSRQQVSELKKAMPKEPKNNGVAMVEVSLRDHSLNSQPVDGAADPPYSDVNFMYLRSVLFKYLTASDPQVASNLIRVVATLLELKPEEEALLRETQETQRGWFNSLIKK